MHFYASIPDFVGAVVIGVGIGIGWTAGCWLTGRALNVMHLG